MKVKLARSAGFCMGVRRALEIVLSEANKKSKGPIFTFGPLIHNAQVLELLEAKGVRVLDDPLSGAKSKVVIRAHGIPPQLRDQLRNAKAEIIDATCPKVARVQAIIKYYTKKGYIGIIVGDPDHPEVIGLKGYGGKRAWVVSDESDLASVPVNHNKVFVVAQTTQNARRYQQIVEKIKDQCPDALIFDTICQATHQRQEEVRALAEQADAVVVVGGFESGNTRRLVEIARSTGKQAFHVETPRDLDLEQLEKMKTVGVTAGASTPNWLIKDVVGALQRVKGKKETALARFVRRAIKFLVLSNIAAALGAAALSYSVGFFLQGPSTLSYPIITFLYVYAMHVLNRFLDRTASAYNEPERASFLMRHGKALAITGAISTMGAIGLSLRVGLSTFVTLLTLSMLGIVYSLPIIPQRLSIGGRYRKIKDIPGSKTISEALAWTALIVVAPLLEGTIKLMPYTLVVGACVFLLAFVRAGIFDIIQFQGDLIAGSETLPIVLGERRTLSVLKTLLWVSSAIVAIPSAFGLTPRVFFLMLVPVGILGLCMWMYQGREKVAGLGFEALVEASFIILGILIPLHSHLWVF